jgi:hypothetical protein
VHHNPPQREEFLSAKDPVIHNPGQSKEAFWPGFSAFDTCELAHATAMTTRVSAAS